MPNKKRFNRSMLFDDRQEKEIFNCVICERNVSLSNSTSLDGLYLVCNECAYKYFNDYYSTRLWQINQKRGVK